MSPAPGEVNPRRPRTPTGANDPAERQAADRAAYTGAAVGAVIVAVALLVLGDAVESVLLFLIAAGLVVAVMFRGRS